MADEIVAQYLGAAEIQVPALSAGPNLDDELAVEGYNAPRIRIFKAGGTQDWARVSQFEEKVDLALIPKEHVDFAKEVKADVLQLMDAFVGEDREAANLPFLCFSLALLLKCSLPHVINGHLESPTRQEINRLPLSSTLRSSWAYLHEPATSKRDRFKC